jgi:PAS domain S-box-containing protein
LKIPENYGTADDLARIVHACPDILTVLSFNGRFTLANEACVGLLGFEPTEILGRSFLELIHPDDQPHSMLALQRLVAGDRLVLWHTRSVRKHGGFVRVQWHATADATQGEIYAAGRDVSAVRIDDELLQEAELKATITVENAPDGILRIAPSGQIVLANRAAVSILGYDSEEDLISQGPELDTSMFVDPDDRSLITEHLSRSNEMSLECRLYRKDRRVIWVAMKVRTTRELTGALSYVEKYLKDITVQRQMEETVRFSETRYRSLVENAPFGIYLTTLDGRFLDVNHALVAMLGYQTREEVMKLNIESDVYTEPGARARLIQQFVNVERIEGTIVQWKRKDHSPIQVSLTARKMRDSFGVLEGFEVIAAQVSKR